MRPEPGRARAYRLEQALVLTEEQEQIALFTWATLSVAIGDHPELVLLHHTPNGGWRDKKTAGRLRAAGVKAGVPDLHLPIARHGYHSLWIELKRADHSNHPSPDQEWWIERLRAEGHCVVVAYGSEEAIAAIEEYLK